MHRFFIDDENPPIDNANLPHTLTPLTNNTNPPQTLTTQQEITLTKENAAHAAVLRLNIGEGIIICDSAGTDYHCIITKISQKEVKASITKIIPNQTEPIIKISLYQALPKAGKMDDIIKNAVQLGIYEINPILTKRCIPKPSQKDFKRVDRWQKISLSAAKQSHRGIVPKVNPIIELKDALDNITANGITANGIATDTPHFVCYEAESDGRIALKQHLKALPKSITRLAFFIGPEGGFSDDEVAAFKKGGMAMVSLGSRILQTQLAGSIALASILYELGEG